MVINASKSPVMGSQCVGRKLRYHVLKSAARSFWDYSEKESVITLNGLPPLSSQLDAHSRYARESYWNWTEDLGLWDHETIGIIILESSHLQNTLIDSSSLQLVKYKTMNSVGLINQYWWVYLTRGLPTLLPSGLYINTSPTNDCAEVLV